MSQRIRYLNNKNDDYDNEDLIDYNDDFNDVEDSDYNQYINRNDDKNYEQDDIQINDRYYNNGIKEDIKGYDNEEYNNYNYNDNKNELEKNFIDNNTGLEMTKIDIGTKQFNVSACISEMPQFKDFASNSEVLIVHFERKQNKDKLLDEKTLNQYISFDDDGNITILKPITSEMIYKIVNTLATDYYLIYTNDGKILPISCENMQNIMQNNCSFDITKNQHICNIKDKNGYKQEPQTLCGKIFETFSKNVDCPSPYAYGHMSIPERVINRSYYRNNSKGDKYKVHAQFSNELIATYPTISNIVQLKSFALKLKDANKIAKYGDDVILAVPFPLYERKHMLSLVCSFTKEGEINFTIINANGRKNAREIYGLEISNILQKMIEEYAPELLENKDKIKYFFYENKSQIGGTCMTHADVITRGIVKDKNNAFDGKNYNPIRILQKAQTRGIASFIYEKAKEQGKFVKNDNKIEEKGRQNKINNLSLNYKVDRNLSLFNEEPETNKTIRDVFKYNNIAKNRNYKNYKYKSCAERNKYCKTTNKIVKTNKRSRDYIINKKKFNKKEKIKLKNFIRKKIRDNRNIKRINIRNYRNNVKGFSVY